MSVFITFEGGEAVGKSTQVEAIYEKLKKDNIPVVKTREPGGTPLAEKIRKIFKSDVKISSYSAVKMNFAARKDHVEKVIAPALEEGKVVLCDRFTDSTHVYQGNLTSKNDPKIKNMINEEEKQLGIKPDKTYLFSASYHKVQERMNKRGNKDKFERSYKDKYSQITQGYEELKKNNPERIKEINTEHLEQSPKIGERIVNNIVSDIKEQYYNQYAQKSAESLITKNAQQIHQLNQKRDTEKKNQTHKTKFHR